MLDILLLRNNPDVVRRSQQARCADPAAVDHVLALDAEWRKLQGKADKLRTSVSSCSRTIAEKKKAKEADGEEAPIPEELAVLVGTADVFPAAELTKLNVTQLKQLSKETDQEVQRTLAAVEEKERERDLALGKIGNIVHEACRPTANEDENDVIRKWGEPRQKTEATLNHVDLCARLGMETGDLATRTAGGRAYFLTGPLVQLQLALINYAMNFLIAKGSTPIYPPYFMTKEAMGAVAQLADFDEMLYKVTGEGEDKYLIATSEQPICAFHRNRWFSEKDLPLKYAGFSTCFRKEAGSHGRDTLGIFRVHQFEKIEQFAVTTCKDGKSWEMLEEMITNSEAFYQTLGIHYRVVRIVAGALNDAAAMKYDLEGWYPASQTYRELVSCSNCTDFQSRRLNARMGSGKAGGQAKEKEFVHMLNATLCAVTRVICCICETYQTPEGIEVPEVLRPYMGGLALLKYTK